MFLTFNILLESKINISPCADLIFTDHLFIHERNNIPYRCKIHAIDCYTDLVGIFIRGAVKQSTCGIHMYEVKHEAITKFARVWNSQCATSQVSF